MTKIPKTPIVLFILLLLSSCGVKQVNEFYLLAYKSNVDKNKIYTNLKFPLKYSLEVENIELNKIYDRNAIVIRKSLHKMTYDKNQKWAVRPNRALTELLIDHINDYQIFSECKNDFIDSNPDFYITGRINSMEKEIRKNNFNANFNITLYFRDKNKAIIFIKKINKHISMQKDDTAFFAKIVSDALKEEINEFIKLMINYFESK